MLLLLFKLEEIAVAVGEDEMCAALDKCDEEEVDRLLPENAVDEGGATNPLETERFFMWVC